MAVAMEVAATAARLRAVRDFFMDLAPSFLPADEPSPAMDAIEPEPA
jgi:hypothetical protein